MERVFLWFAQYFCSLCLGKIMELTLFWGGFVCFLLLRGPWWWSGSLIMVNREDQGPSASTASCPNNVRAYECHDSFWMSEAAFLFSLHLPSLLPPLSQQWHWDKMLADLAQTFSGNFLLKHLLSDIGTIDPHWSIFLVPSGKVVQL